MNTTTAVVLYTGPREDGPVQGEDERVRGAKTPLRAFCDHVEALVSRGSVSRLGAVFSGMPFERVLALGAYPLLIKAAGPTLLNMSLSSEADVELVAERVDRMVNIGLVLKFSTMEEAAAAFVADVTSAIEAKLRSMTDGSVIGLDKLCQRSVAMFLASCWKSASEAHGEFAELISEVEENNRSKVFHGLEIVDLGRFRVQSAYSIVRMTDLRVGGPLKLDKLYASTREWVDSFGGVATRLAEVGEMQGAMTEIARRVGSMPAEVFDGSPGALAGHLENRFLMTHLLLAALGAPENSEHVTTRELIDAMQVLMERSDDDLIEAFFARMEVRGAMVSRKTRVVLTPVLVKRLSEQRDPKSYGFGFEERDYMFLLVQIDQHLLGAEEALELATGQRPDDVRRIKKLDRASREAFLSAKVVDAIVWADLEFDQVFEMIGGVIPLWMLADGIVLLNEEVRDAIVEHILGMRGVFDKESIARFAELSLIEIDDEFVDRHFGMLSEERELAYVTELFVGSRVAEGKLQRKRAVEALLKLEPEVARAIVAAPKARYAVADALFNALLASERSPRPEFTAKVCKALWVHLGDLLPWYALANEIMIRMTSATSRGTDAGEDDDDPASLAWADIHMDPVWEEQAAWLGWSAEQLAGFTSGRYTEEAVFRWVMEYWDLSFVTPSDRDHVFTTVDNVDDGWRLYKTLREEHYASYGVQVTV